MKQRLLKDQRLVCSSVSIGVEPTMNSSAGWQSRELMALHEHLHLLLGGGALRSPSACRSPSTLTRLIECTGVIGRFRHSYLGRSRAQRSHASEAKPSLTLCQRTAASTLSMRPTAAVFRGTVSLAASHCDTTSASERLTRFTTMVGWLVAGLQTGFAGRRCAH